MRQGLRETLRALRAGLPVAVLLALAIGLAVAIGAQLSNAFPSAAQPFGWPGPANFENGVAMVRPELVLAASLPALLLGLNSIPRDGRTPWTLPVLGAGVALVAGATLAATLLAASVATISPGDAYFAFWAAHTLLALSFFAIGLLARAATRRHAAVAGLATWTVFGVLMDDFVRWRLFRSEGYDNLASGLLPNWFYVLQALSPVAAYRAILILWRPGFRDFLEHRALDKATMPGWLTPTLLSMVMVLLWVALPMGIAALLLHLRGRRKGTAAPSAPLLPLAPAAGAAAGAMPAPDEAKASALVRVAPERPDRPPPVTGPRRPRLSADSRAETLRASFRPPRPGRRR
ncbi:MAG: hypothetical protein LC620_01980 [Halobacteriales archaeon]|nr:hypothetical protein [Halobacteriales archaeon]